MSSKPMEDVIIATSVAYSDHVTARMREVPDGFLLCVHDSVNADVKNEWKVTYEIQSHFVQNENELCSIKGRKAVFGRKVTDVS